VPRDTDFESYLEVLKTDNVQQPRYTGETTILPGCYLRATARIKWISRASPTARIGGRAGGGAAVTGAGCDGAVYRH
jgi:hypothetical protein